MAPNQNYMLTDASGEPVSRTYQYRKVMKPLLERKRRARINRCLDELKELMTGALQAQEGENVAKLEKADILELTVHHLHALRRQNQLGSHAKNSYAEKFKAGFRHCAAEVSTFLGVLDQDTSLQVVKHLATCLNHIENAHVPSPAAIGVPAQQPNQMNRPRPNVQIQTPNQINASACRDTQMRPHHAVTPNRMLIPTSSPPPPPPSSSTVAAAAVQQAPQAMAALQQFQKEQSQKILLALQFEQSKRNQQYHEMTQIHTPPMSPKIDVDDSSVWRPW